jgi:formiminotetrahydrofolate cyclodeaminase
LQRRYADKLDAVTSPPIGTWLDDLAAREPVPGGGGAAALAAATAAALVSMVAKYTTGERYADVEVEATAIDAEAERIRASALELMERDAEAFAAVGAAYALPRDDAEDRKARIQAALAGAAEPPTAVAHASIELVELAARLEPIANRNVLSDVGVAASMAAAALESALINIEVNRALITDEGVRDALAGEIEAAEPAHARAAEIASSVRKAIRG